MNAYTVVGPTNFQPRFFKSFDIDSDSGLVASFLTTAAVSFLGREDAGGSNRQTYAASEPNSSISSNARWALLIAASIKAGLALYYGLGVVAAQSHDADVLSELEAIMADYPQANVQMGYGDGSRYINTFSRVQLVFAGNTLFKDNKVATK